MSEFEKIKRKEKAIYKKIEEILPTLKDIDKEMCKLYETLRYENLDITSEEYSVLFDTFVRPFEDLDIDVNFIRLIDSLKEIKKEGRKL